MKKTLTVPVCTPQEWQEKSFDTGGNTVHFEFVNKSLGWANDDDQIWKTEDGGSSWTEQFYPIPEIPTERILSNLQMIDEMNGIISLWHWNAPDSFPAILVTRNGGQSWEEKMLGTENYPNAIVTENGEIFGSGQFDGLFYSSDWGESFIEIPTPGIDLSRLMYLGNNSLVATGLERSFQPPFSNKTISFSEDGGLSWSHRILPALYYGSRGFHFFNSKKGFVAGYHGFLLKTEDGGENWEEVRYDDDRRVINVHFIDEQTGWAVGLDGLVLSTTDGGDTWIRGNCGRLSHLSSIDAVDSETCRISSTHGKYLQLNLSAEADCPSENNGLNAGEDNLLIFPNPTFDAVTITFTKPSASIQKNRIIISNNLGQRMFESSMLNETLTINTTSWSSGVYWVQWFQNQEFIEAKKFIVLD